MVDSCHGLPEGAGGSVELGTVRLHLPQSAPLIVGLHVNCADGVCKNDDVKSVGARVAYSGADAIVCCQSSDEHAMHAQLTQ